MKTTFLLFGLFLGIFLIAQKKEPISKPALGQFKWNNGKVIDLGKIEKDKPVTITYKFTNTGNVPLIISSVRPSCGCTNVEYSKEPVSPGSEGFLKVTNNASNTGVFNKSIVVYANIEGGQDELTIKGETYNELSKKPESVNDTLSVSEAYQLIKDNKSNSGFIILDVRTPGEFNESHIENSINIDRHASDFEVQLAKLDKNKTYIIYCKRGVRSAYALNLMKKLGITNSKHIRGGIDEWKTANYPVTQQ